MLKLNREIVKLIRHSYGMNAVEFSDWIGVGVSTLQHYEGGYSNSETVPNAIAKKVPSHIILSAKKLLDKTEIA